MMLSSQVCHLQRSGAMTSISELICLSNSLVLCCHAAAASKTVASMFPENSLHI
jgi:hypothetical protein